MKCSIFALISYLIHQTCASVVQLNDTNFETYINQTPVALVAFTSSWCFPSYVLNMELEQASIDLENDTKKGFFNMDCEQEDIFLDTCWKYNVRQYPTLITFKNGKYYEKYNDGRDKSKIVHYMQSQKSKTNSLLLSPVLMLICVILSSLKFLVN